MSERRNRDGAEGKTEVTAGAVRVLLLDDHADTLAFMTRLLSRMGAEVVAAATCAAARYAMQTLNGFDLLVTDVVLDDGDGVDLAVELKKAHGCAVVVLSGVERTPTALPAGVDLWLPKPIEVARFEEAVRGLLRARAGDLGSG